MLVLTRKVREKIIIDCNTLGDHPIEIMISSIDRSQVSIGIEAPKHIAVHREEVYRKIQREKQEEDEKSNGNTTDCLEERDPLLPW